MSCFHIPKAITNAIDKECANFWWGLQVGKRNMHRKTWQALCVPKCMGGLGFRQLESFNKALLAKQLWRIIIELESVVARVLKARYFKHQDIVHASLGSNPSYIWQSLLWSRHLFKEGLRWRVCTGEKISTFQDLWIPGIQSLSRPPGYQFDLETVNTLILNGSWNETLLHKVLLSYIVQDVMALPLATGASEDSRYWFHDVKGKYSVKDGYKLDIGFYKPPTHSSILQSKKWWKFLLVNVSAV
ncbi:putative mitochondrial protein AtMg00310 [Primulina tabacum]|uniref:putative mitochondrial protein AtMg00310 n=1 Tax=Primulina tabacum TaxID=48773 RepID=UPI003F59AAA0